MEARKIVVVTGASRGIGRAIAQRLSGAGWTVFGTSRSPAAEIDGEVAMLPLSLESDQSVQRCVDEVLARAGRIDALVNNAGFDLYGALEETSLDELRMQMDTNFMGAARMMKAVLAPMRQQGGGRIVNVSSLGGRLGLPMNGAYAASKFALGGLSESVRLEMLPHGVFVSLVEPGAVATDTLDQSIREVAADDSAYAAARRAMVQRMRADGLRSAVTPAHVAQQVSKALGDRHPALRYTVGAQATWVPRMKSVLPASWFEGFMRRTFVDPHARSQRPAP